MLRRCLLVGIGLCVLVGAYSLVRYPRTVLPLQTGLLFASVFFAVLFGYLAIALYSTRGRSPEIDRPARLGLCWGLFVAGFWTLEILAGNFADARNVGMAILYFGGAALAFASPLFAAIWCARQSGRFLMGTWAGIWSGLISGLLTFLIIMAVAHLFVDTLINDPQNRSQFQASAAPDIATFVIGDFLAAGTGHLIIGLLSGLGLGAVGGFFGKWLARSRSLLTNSSRC